MNAYTEAQLTVVRQIQAERRAEAAAHRLVAQERGREAVRADTDRRAAWLHRLAAPLRMFAPATRT